jgi:hypothetical protein
MERSVKGRGDVVCSILVCWLIAETTKEVEVYSRAPLHPARQTPGVLHAVHDRTGRGDEQAHSPSTRAAVWPGPQPHTQSDG